MTTDLNYLMLYCFYIRIEGVGVGVGVVLWVVVVVVAVDWVIGAVDRDVAVVVGCGVVDVEAVAVSEVTFVSLTVVALIVV